MCGNFIEQQDGPTASLFSHQVSMGQNNAEKQRLLLPRRTAPGRLPLAKMLYRKVAPMWSGKCASRGCIAWPPLREFGNKFPLVLPAFQPQSSPRKRSIHRSCDSLVQHGHKCGPRARDGCTMLRHLCFQSTKPVGICGLVCSEQAIALTHRGIVSGRMPRMCRLEGEDQPVQKASALASAIREESVHCWRQPHD